MQFTNLYNTRFKKLALGIYIIIILAIIFAIAFNKRDTFLFFAKVPDYSTDKGYKIVSISDYDKYKQGYCLKENKILPKEEIIKRGIVDFMRKRELYASVERKICYWYFGNAALCNDGDGFNPTGLKVGFYETANINSYNLLSYITKKYSYLINPNKKEAIFLKILRKELGGKEPMDLNSNIDLRIDIKNGYAGFDNAVIYYNWTSSFDIYLDKSFHISDDLMFNVVTIHIYAESIWDDIDYLKKEKELYNKALISNKKYKYSIDNCGNSSLDIYESNVENKAKEAVKEMFQGG